MAGVLIDAIPPPKNVCRYDPRFPNTNQSQHCWTRYNEWILCQKKAPDSEICKPVVHIVILPRAPAYLPCVGCSLPFRTFFATREARRFMNGICPNEWVERWDEEREEGNFAGIK